MPTGAEIREQVAAESAARRRLAVPAFAGGFLYLLSTITISTTLKGAPTVGLFQGLEPALRGEATPVRSPRAEEVIFISHHPFPLIAGSVLASIAVIALTLVLMLLAAAVTFRRPEAWRGARPLALGGGIAVAILGVAHQVVSAIVTHRFATGRDFSAHAVDNALTKGAANVLVAYLSLAAALALAAGMIALMMGGLRTGLLPRWLAILGIFSAVLILLPVGAQLQVVPAFWMVMIGVLLMGRWPGGDPPAWAAGEARPWPSAASRRQGATPAPAPAGPAAVPEPTPPAAASRRRRKKRSGRR